ncbi:MAG: glycoside hydrolase family 9 protein [Fibrobacteria bacterium]|nr:glycoside hydrolase family 9 protein [Fibrobacteria bacterium]
MSRRVLDAVVGILVAAVVGANAQTAIDNTCATCGRRALDSANLTMHAVRVNQVGYITADPAKRALVANPRSSTFQIVRRNGTVAYSGNLVPQGKGDRGRIRITGYFNSITPLYRMTNDTSNVVPEDVSEAVFGGFREEGSFRIAVGPDTSLPFDIRADIYNDVLETNLKFFGIARSGDNDSWFHGPSHMKDGSARGAGKAGSLQGGWYDCGDHFKVGQTIAYAFQNLILTYTLWPQKAEDRYGSSYNDTIPFGNDGIPDILREAKIGADYLMRLYNASVEDGLLAKQDMYLQVGVALADHQYWDRPEYQDAQPAARGGPDRVIHTAQGSAVPASFAGSLALFARAWEPFDPAFADSCLRASRDIYAKIVVPRRDESGWSDGGFYIAQGRWDDDLAWAAAALWISTQDTLYKFHLMGNTAFGDNPGAVFNPETFRAGFLARHRSKLFSPGGWIMDYQNNFIHTMWLLHNLVYRTDSLAARMGVPALEAQELRTRIRTVVGERYASESTNGGPRFPGTMVNVQVPYGLVWTSSAWGMNRYNLGGLLPVVAYHDMIREDSATAAAPYWDIVLRNMNYNLGTNPWDISFLMGAGSKNLQHPHHRASNPEGYNAGGIPYAYRPPKGALMGGAIPGQVLLDEWEKYDATETCIDFSAQNLLPAQYLAEDLPPDVDGPLFRNVTVVQVTNTTALVSWETDELSRDTLFYSLTPGGPVIGQEVVSLGKKKTVEITGLTPDTPYWFFFKGMDIFRNVSRDDNRGRFYTFTTTVRAVGPPVIQDIRVCNIRHDRATVFWWTDVPSTSAVEFAPEGGVLETSKVRVEGDDEGLPGRFHKVTLKGLKPGTAYRFDVLSGGARGDSGGLHHRFETIKDFASYTIQVKATDKNGAANGHFYLEVANNEPRPYVGLELRFYFQAPATVAQSLVVHSNDKQMFDVGGMAGPLDVLFGTVTAVPGIADQWYLPITLVDTLPVAGRARIELKMDDAGWNPIPLSVFQSAWSLVPHANPVAFPGLDFSHLWKGPDHVETWNGTPYVTYVQTPYITAHYQGVHVYGYPPDGAKPRVTRTTDFRFSSPLPSPATSLRQDSLPVHFAGRTWSWPDVARAQWQVDGPFVRPAAPLAGRLDSVGFKHDTGEVQGTNTHEFAFWGDRDSSYCSCAWTRYTVVADTQKIPPPRYRLVWVPQGGVSGQVGSRLPLSVVLASDTADTVDVNGSIDLSSIDPRMSFFASGSATNPVSTFPVVSGVATVWVSSEQAVDSARIQADGKVRDAIVTPEASGPISFYERVPPRYRLVWKPDTALVASVGSRLPFELRLVSDTLDPEPMAAVVTLQSTVVGVQFFETSASASPVSRISLVDGVARIWIGSLGSVDSALVLARGSVVDGIVDSGWSSWISFVPPPPWPLIDSASFQDTDCDGATDLARFFLNSAPGTARLLALQAILGTDSVRAAPVWNADSTILSVPVAPAIVGTRPLGTVRIHWSAQGNAGADTVVVVEQAVLDRVGPRIVSASVLENFAPGVVPDTFRVEFSEPVSLGQPGWPFADLVPVSPALGTGRMLSPNLVEWVIPPGGATVHGGDVLRSSKGGFVVDASGNPPSGCGSDSAVVAVRARPVPLRRAVLLDVDGDGQGDLLQVDFARSLRDAEFPDSITGHWNGSQGAFSRSEMIRGSDSSRILLALSPQWQGASPDALSRLVSRSGVGADLWLDSIPLEDGVGPSLRAAILRYGTDWDTLVLRVSEPVTAGLGLELDRWSTPLVPATRREEASPSLVRLVFPSQVVQEGDSLRLTPVWSDGAGNPAAPNAVRVPVFAGDRPPSDAWLVDRDGDGRADQVVMTWDRPYKRPHGYVFHWEDGSRMVTRTTEATDFHPTGPMSAYVDLPDPFPSGATGLVYSSSSPALQLEFLDGFSDSLRFEVRDSVDPIVRDAELRYASEEGAPDTLVVLFSEGMLLQPILPQVLLHVRGPSTLEAPVAQWVVTQSADGVVARLLLQPSDSFQTRFARGDSVRVAPAEDATIRDLVGNVAAGPSPWVPVRFGARPSRFLVEMHPRALHRMDPTHPPRGDQVLLLVRAKGARDWRTLDGQRPGELDHRIGPKVTINVPFGGRVHFYDNIGTAVSGMGLEDLEAATLAGRVPTAADGQYEVWFAWNGADLRGHPVGSGVYTVRLALRRNVASPESDPAWEWSNDLIKFGWMISIP